MTRVHIEQSPCKQSIVVSLRLYSCIGRRRCYIDFPTSGNTWGRLKSPSKPDFWSIKLGTRNRGCVQALVTGFLSVTLLTVHAFCNCTHVFKLNSRLKPSTSALGPCTLHCSSPHSKYVRKLASLISIIHISRAICVRNSVQPRNCR